MATKKWTEDKITQMIKDMNERREDLSARFIHLNHSDLESAAVSIFGSWKKAIEAAELDYSLIRRQKKWTPDSVVKELIRLYEEEEDISPGSLHRNHSSLYAAGRRYFLNSDAMYEAAKINPREAFKRKPDGFWTKRKIIDSIKERLNQHKDLRRWAVAKENASLVWGAEQFFKSWPLALEAAKIDSSKYLTRHPKGYWNHDTLIAEIRKLNEKHIDLHYLNIRKNYGELDNAAQELFDGWYNALDATEIDANQIRKFLPKGYWTEPRIKEEILAYHREGEDLSHASMLQKDAGLVKGAIKRYGTWKSAVEAAGLDYHKIRKDKMMESFMGATFEKYVKEMLEALGWKITYQDHLAFEDERCRPDFIDITTGTWIDAKIDSWSPTVSSTIVKYLRHTNNLKIIYLKGSKRDWDSDKVTIIPVKSFYDDLAKIGRNDLIRDFEKLRLGISRPKLQVELD